MQFLVINISGFFVEEKLSWQPDVINSSANSISLVTFKTCFTVHKGRWTVSYSFVSEIQWMIIEITSQVVSVSAPVNMQNAKLYKAKSRPSN